jgi:hypothetical protein
VVALTEPPFNFIWHFRLIIFSDELSIFSLSDTPLFF